jgi:hypothetical protein
MTSRLLAWLASGVLLVGCSEPLVESPATHTPEPEELPVFPAATAAGALSSEPETDPDDDDAVDPDVCDEAHPENTVGLKLCDPRSAPGYTLFSPMRSPMTYLVDTFGRQVHAWEAESRPANSVYLLDDGALLRTGALPEVSFQGAGARGGRVEILEWDGAVRWRFDYSSSDVLTHHDVEPMPGGTVMLLAWEVMSEVEAITVGRDPATVDERGLWMEHLIEVDPSDDSIVWEWHQKDHLVQQFDPAAARFGVPFNNPGRIDINAGSAGEAPNPDWTHANSVAYSEELDQIILSAHSQNEIWVIDHGTTSEEAAQASGGAQGHGGDLLYRWGNPAIHGAGTEADRQLRRQHDAHWIPAGTSGAGNVLIFNNHDNNGRSTVLEIVTPWDGTEYVVADGLPGPVAPLWRTEADFFSPFIAGAQRLPNGNTLVCVGTQGRLLEYTAEGELVWDYTSPVGPDGPLDQGEPVGEAQLQVFRATRIPLDHPGLPPLEAGDPIEL